MPSTKRCKYLIRKTKRVCKKSCKNGNKLCYIHYIINNQQHVGAYDTHHVGSDETKQMETIETKQMETIEVQQMETIETQQMETIETQHVDSDETQQMEKQYCGDVWWTRSLGGKECRAETVLKVFLAVCREHRQCLGRKSGIRSGKYDED